MLVCGGGWGLKSDQQGLARNKTCRRTLSKGPEELRGVRDNQKQRSSLPYKDRLRALGLAAQAFADRYASLWSVRVPTD